MGLTGWKSLSLSQFGEEEVVVKDVEDGILVARINAYPKAVPMKKIYDSYKKRLYKEAEILNESIGTYLLDGACWMTYVWRLAGLEFPVILYAICEKEDRYCTISVNCPSFIALRKFMDGFNEFVEAADFRCCERGVLEEESFRVVAIGISDVVLRAEQDGVLLFFGKNKYFFVSIDEVPQLDVIRDAMGTGDVRFVRKSSDSEGMCMDTFDVLRNGRVSGSIELQTVPCGSKKFINVFGYWSGERESDIGDNLIVRLEECDCV